MAENIGGKIGLVEENVLIEVRDEHGVLKESIRLSNTVTTAGKQGAADQILAGPTLNKPTYMAVGTGTPGGSALGAELDRNAFSSKTRSGAVVTMVASWGTGEAIGGLTEAGIFDASSAGNMWCSATFPVVNKGTNDTVTLTWTLTFS